MLFPIIPALTITTLAFPLKDIIKNILQLIIGDKIDCEIEYHINNARNKINLELKKYFKNFYTAVAVDAAIILFAFLIFFIIKVNTISITIYSIIIIAVLIKYIFNILKDINRIKPYFAKIKAFIKIAYKNKSFIEAFKFEVFKQVENVYNEKTTKFVRKLHEIGVDIGLVKSIYYYQNLIYFKIISLINEKPIKKKLILAGIILVFYSTVALVIKLIVFSVTLDMNTIDIVIYPIKLLITYFIS